MEFKRALGCSSRIPHVLQCSESQIVYSLGAIVVKSSISQPPDMQLLRGHDDTITCIASCNQFIASGQYGQNAGLFSVAYLRPTLLGKTSSCGRGVTTNSFIDFANTNTA